MTKESPFARPETYRRLIKPHSFSYINDICAVIVEERERLEHELFSSAALEDTHLRGMLYAVQRLSLVEERISRVLTELNKKQTEDGE